MITEGWSTGIMDTWFLSSPYDPVYVRRGDPLGFRGLSDHIAEILSPGLSNQTRDARWLSILGWILVAVDEARRGYGYEEPASVSRDQARDIYSWIRPLELLWIARSFVLLNETERRQRQLPGIRSIRRWQKDGRYPERFGMTPHQFTRYRFVGPYGFYRVLLCGLEGMTVQGDGFRPGPLARNLAKAVGTTVPAPRRPHYQTGPKKSPENHWREAWPWNRRKGNGVVPWLPEPRVARPRLSAEEKALLHPALFEQGVQAKRRRFVAEIAAQSKAKDHEGLCSSLATRIGRKAQKTEIYYLDRLVPFTRLADAGVDLMDIIWGALSESESETGLKISSLTKEARVGKKLEILRRACLAWRVVASKAPDGRFLPTLALAESITNAKTDTQTIEALVQHHVKWGGGRRWFMLRSGKIVRDTRASKDLASRYRFRLWALSRLAWQCGVISRMPPALIVEAQSEGDAENEGDPGEE